MTSLSLGVANWNYNFILVLLSHTISATDSAAAAAAAAILARKEEFFLGTILLCNCCFIFHMTL